MSHPCKTTAIVFILRVSSPLLHCLLRQQDLKLFEVQMYRDYKDSGLTQLIDMLFLGFFPLLFLLVISEEIYQ